MFTPSPQQTPIVPGTTFSRPALPTQAPVSKVFYFFTGGMFLLALASFAAAGFAFYKRDNLAQMVEEKKQELNNITYSQEGATLQDMEDLSGRLKGVVSIFTGAPSAGSVFLIFENSVERGIAFNRLDLKRVEGTNSYKVSVVGRAGKYQDLILQRSTLQGSPYSKYASNVTIDSFSRDIDAGDLPFTMSMLISVGRFSTSNLLVDLNKPSDNLVPKQQTNPVQVVDVADDEDDTEIVSSTTAASTSSSPAMIAAPR